MATTLINQFTHHARWMAQFLFISLLLIILDTQCQVRGQRRQDNEQVIPVASPAIKTKIIIPNLDPNHYRFWLKNHPLAFKEFGAICSQLPHPMDVKNLKYFQSIHSNVSMEDPNYLKDLNYGKRILNTICQKFNLITKSCWGYESNCHLIYLMPECYDENPKDEQDKKIAWFSQADFGYILDRRKEMGKYCSPDKYSNDSWISSFECTKFFKTCRGQNLYMKFDNIPKMNVSSSLSMIKQEEGVELLKKGNIGGWNCDLQLKRIQEEDGQRGFLKSWFNELKNYNIIPQAPKESCDITIEKQAFIIKLDSPSNMYHYFCNFLNLYATIHLNNKFSDDNEIIIWDNHLPRGKFELMWQAFSRNPIRHIGQFEGKRVCFKKFIFSLLPRMVDGLYYNTPLVKGCSKTGLFDAFNKHILHRLNVPLEDRNLIRPLNPTTGNDKQVLRVTIVKRSTPHRRIVNELDFVNAIKGKLSHQNFHVQLIDYAELNFKEQLRISRNTDILIGIHGAGLTNLLFLPDWAALIQLYHCGDEQCYKDLARLRGVSYFAPPERDLDNYIEKVQIEDEEEQERLVKRKLVSDKKFVNYRINVEKFLALLEKAAERVRGDRKKYLTEQEIQPKSQPQVEPDLKTDNTKEETVVNVKNTPTTTTTTTTPKPHEEL